MRLQSRGRLLFNFKGGQAMKSVLCGLVSLSLILLDVGTLCFIGRHTLRLPRDPHPGTLYSLTVRPATPGSTPARRIERDEKEKHAVIVILLQGSRT